MNGPGFQEDIGRLVINSEQPAGTWAAGTTKEISKFPPHSNKKTGDFFYLAGTASIEHSSDFSPFGGYDRIHMPICGNGERLLFQDPTETIVLNNYDQYFFSGLRKVHANLIDGEITAFNLMLGHGVAGAVEVKTYSTDPVSLLLNIPTDGSTNLIQFDHILYAVNGSLVVQINDQREVNLDQGDGFILPFDLTKEVHVPEIYLLSRNSTTDVVIASLQIASDARGAV